MQKTRISFRSLLALAGGLGASIGAGWADEPAADRLGGSLGGIRTRLASIGLTTGLDYTAEIFSVARGGLHRGNEFEGLGNLTLDGASAEGRPGATFAFHANIFAMHGDSISDAQAGDTSHLSNIDYQDAVRLFECWGE